MRDVVRRAFYGLNAPMEGEVPYFYQDVKGLVSIGVGLLADTSNRPDVTTPPPIIYTFPMVHADGRAATREEIHAEWSRINALGSGTAREGNPAAIGGHLFAKPHTRLRFSAAGLRQSHEAKMRANEKFLLRGFPDCEEWPADAQLGLLSMAWAVGPAFWSPDAGPNHWPKLTAALRAGDFKTASVECFLKEANWISGLRPRNAANRLLFENAEIVKLAKLPRDVIYYPRELGKTEAPTEPEIPNPPSSPRPRVVIDDATLDAASAAADEFRKRPIGDDDA